MAHGTEAPKEPIERRTSKNSVTNEQRAGEAQHTNASSPRLRSRVAIIREYLRVGNPEPLRDLKGTSAEGRRKLEISSGPPGIGLTIKHYMFR